MKERSKPCPVPLRRPGGGVGGGGGGPVERPRCSERRRRARVCARSFVLWHGGRNGANAAAPAALNRTHINAHGARALARESKHT